MNSLPYSGSLEQQVSAELTATADYLSELTGAVANAPTTNTVLALAAIGISLGVVAVPAVGWLSLLSATMALSGGAFVLGAEFAAFASKEAGSPLSANDRDAIELVSDLGSNPFVLVTATGTIAVGAGNLKQGVDIGRLISAIASITDLVTDTKEIEALSAALDLATIGSPVSNIARDLQRRQALAHSGTERSASAADARAEQAGLAAEMEAIRYRAAKEQELQISMEMGYLRGLELTKQMEQVIKSQTEEAERRRKEESERIRSLQEEQARKYREGEQLRKVKEEAEKRAAEAADQAQRQLEEERRNWWADQAEKERQRAADASKYENEANWTSNQIGFTTVGQGSNWSQAVPPSAPSITVP